MSRTHRFILAKHSSECFADYIKKSFVIDIFSPQKNGMISVNLEIRLLPEEKIEVKNIFLNHPSLCNSHESELFFMGCFGFQDKMNFHNSVYSLATVLQDSHATPSYGSGAWAEFADQFKDWFDSHIRHHLLTESKVSTHYFKD